MINWLIFCSFVASMTMTFLGLLVDLTYQIQYAPKIESLQKDQKNHWSDYLENEKYFASHPVFRSRKAQTNDFSEKLSLLQKGDLQSALIKHEVKKDLFSLGPKWLNHKNKIPKLESVNQLFADISTYDHWSITHNPGPHLAAELIVAGQIYLAWHFHNKPSASRAALEKVRHLSTLLIQTQSLNFIKAGLSLLEKEWEFVEVMKSRYRQAQVLWTPIDPSELRKYRVHMGKTAEFLSPISDDFVFEKSFLNESLPLNFCALYKGKEKLLLWSEQFLYPQFPLEPSFKKRTKQLRKVKKIAMTHCEKWDRSKKTKRTWKRKIPYYRRIYGINVILNAEKSRKVL